MSQQSSGSTAVVAAVMLLLLLVAAGGGLYAWQSKRAMAEMRLAAEQLKVAKMEALRAREIALQAEQPSQTKQVPGRELQPLTPASSAPEKDSVESTIRDKLAEQQSAWNAGDIDQFMEVYWKSDQLTFASGGKVTRGWQATRDGYKTRYPDSATMGQLTFDQLEFKPVGSEVMLVIGNWHLDREKAIGGKFSLIWQQIDGQWVIVHDHTSLAD